MIRELRILFKLFPCIMFVVDAKLCWKLEHFVRAKETKCIANFPALLTNREFTDGGQFATRQH